MGNNLVYTAPEPSYHPLEYQSEFIWVPRDTESESERLEHGIPCLILQHPGATRLLIYFHANAEDLGQVYVHLRYFRSLLGVHVMAVEYPGYGVCSGAPSEGMLLADADSVWRFVRDQVGVPSHTIMLMGRSLGGAPAIYLASKHSCAGLVTVATFSSIRAIAGSLLGLLGWVVDTFDNESRIRSVSSPTLIIHGTRDTIVNVEQARELVRACGADADRRPPSMLSLRRGVNHNNMCINSDIIAPILEAFPSIREGEPIDFSSLSEFLKAQPRHLAPDVFARVPYGPNWRPRDPPFIFRQIRSMDGELI